MASDLTEQGRELLTSLETQEQLLKVSWSDKSRKYEEEL